MNDPSQPNDEGITALHNAICGGHYNVVDFLVRSGANVSAPDSHSWCIFPYSFPPTYIINISHYLWPPLTVLFNY